MSNCMQVKISKATSTIILDRRFVKQDGTHPVKLRITFQRIQKYYALGISLSEDDYRKTMGEKPREQFKKFRKQINEIAEQADQIKDELIDFSFEEFERRFIEPANEKTCLLKGLEAISKKYFDSGSISTASLYNSTIQSLKAFTGKNQISFNKVTSGFLNDYENWMLKEKRSITTISMYLRCVRATMNKARKSGVISKELIPFNKYEIPGTVNVKKALSTSEISRIYNHPVPESSSMEKYRAFWLFSYFCNGMNIKDIALLKWCKIDSETITFERAKTKHKNRKNLKSIVVPLTIEIAKIIDNWGIKSGKPDDYVFPILEKGCTPARERALITQKTKLINKYMKRIGFELGLDKKITTYTARHSFATVLKQAGASIEFISESLGHSNINTTEGYLASFELDKKKQYANELIKFLHNEK